MPMRRVVNPEFLDMLPTGDPEAIRSRRDLCRINLIMGSHCVIGRELRANLPFLRLPSEQTITEEGSGRRPVIVDLASGDGSEFLRIARRARPLEQCHATIDAVLIDKQRLVQPSTLQRFSKLRFRVEVVEADVFDWLASGMERCAAITTNLFLHHLQRNRLAALFAMIAERTDLFVAFEPRRGYSTLALSSLVPLLGCNRITHHDSMASIRAGFAGTELSSLWPLSKSWSLKERSIGVAGHLFVATAATPAASQ